MRRIGQCFNVKLAEIYKQAIKLDELNQIIREYIPENLRGHCFVGSFNNGLLVLNTTDSVWSTQLRYLLPELRDYLRKVSGLYQLTSIKIHISAHTPMCLISKGIQPNQISEKARESIMAQSEDCVYEPLKRALQSLACSD